MTITRRGIGTGDREIRIAEHNDVRDEPVSSEAQVHGTKRWRVNGDGAPVRDGKGVRPYTG